MPAAPVIKASIDFSNGVAFVGEPFILDSVTNGILGTNQLALNSNVAVDITDLLVSVNIRRGRQRILAEFEAGTAAVTIYDLNGDAEHRGEIERGADIGMGQHPLVCARL